MRTVLALLALLGILLFVSQARAEEARVSEIWISLDGDRVLAAFTLRNAFDRRLARRLESGLPTSILYRLELHRDRKRWYDDKLEENTLEAVAIYDALARAYTINLKLDGKLIESRTVRDRQAAEAAMTQIGPLPVFSVAGLPRRSRLLIKVQAELGTRNLLSFIPMAIETDWKDSPKFRPPGP
jgi:hypothetical protein